MALIAIFLFTSCGSSLTVTKRQHNKGYYVSFNKIKHSDRSNPEEALKEESNTNEENTAIRTAEGVEENTEIISTSTEDDVAATDTDMEEVSAPEVKKKNTFVSNALNLKKAVNEKVEGSATKIKNSFSTQQDEMSTPAPREDGLSLLWIIILVILILWLLGFLGGIGGSLIHLLLVIALILLILWLLGII